MGLRDEAERVERRTSRDPLVGTVINGKFHVHKAIARGGMGRIYYGTQAPLDRPVALKIVKADSINEEESQFLRRFLLEASILAKLQHPNVVTLFDYGRIEGASVEMYFIAMEYLNGETLTERLRTRGALPAFEALTLFRQIARGLREAHVRGIVHRDLKPSNIVIVPEADGEIVKLVDFGIGKDERGGEDLTRDGVLVGTPKYMAPEQFDGASSPASDVYALGIIVFQILTGGIPFAGNTMAEFMIAKLQHPIPAMRDVNPICDATDTLENLVYRMLARRVEERPTLDEVFSQLAICEEEVFGASGARLALSGSGPRQSAFPLSSRSLSLGAVQPYTVVGPHGAPPHAVRAHSVPPHSMPPHGHGLSPHTGPPAPGMQSVTPPPGVPSITPHPALGGFTPRPMASTTHPPATQPVRSGPSMPVMVLLFFMVTTLVAGGIWLARGRLAGGDSNGTIPLTIPSTSVGGPSSATIPSAPTTASASFVLRLESTPSGASVVEDGSTLGVTPLDIPIDRSSVADGKARSFQLKKEGFAPSTITQSASDTGVKQTVTLAPDAPRTVKSSSPHTTSGSRPGSGGGGTKPPVPGPTADSDIRLKR
jgi:serine/threonine protein kinase